MDNQPTIWGYGPPPEQDVWPASPPPRGKRKGANLVLVGTVALASAALSAALTMSLVEPVMVPVTSPSSPVMAVGEERLVGAPGLEEALGSVFTVAVKSPTGSGSGSGFAVSPSHIATNAHVVTVGGQASGDITVEVQDSMGQEYAAKVVGIDVLADVAVLSVPGLEARPLEWGESEDIEVGQSVVAVGAPLGLSNTVTSGIVSTLNRPVSLAGDGGEDSTTINAVQTDAAINSGNSGGPLVDKDGRLVGINVAISTGPDSTGSIGIGYAIPASYAQRIVEELIENGEAQHGRIGVEVSTRGSAGGAFEDGAQVEAVVSGGPGSKAGLKEGDVILSWNGEPVPSAGSLIGFVKAELPSTEVTLTVERQERVRVLKLTVGELD